MVRWRDFELPVCAVKGSHAATLRAAHGSASGTAPYLARSARRRRRRSANPRASRSCPSLRPLRRRGADRRYAPHPGRARDPARHRGVGQRRRCRCGLRVMSIVRAAEAYLAGGEALGPPERGRRRAAADLGRLVRYLEYAALQRAGERLRVAGLRVGGDVERRPWTSVVAASSRAGGRRRRGRHGRIWTELAASGSGSDWRMRPGPRAARLVRQQRAGDEQAPDRGAGLAARGIAGRGREPHDPQLVLQRVELALRARLVAGVEERLHAVARVRLVDRIGVDVYPQQIGVSLREVESFGKYLGGSSTNVAVAAARYGRTRRRRSPARATTRSARSSTTRCAGFGVDDRWVTPVRRAADAGDVLRDLPAGRLPAVLLPRAEGAGPGDPRRRARPRRDPRGQGLLGHGHRALAGTVAQRDARRAAGRDGGITVLDLDYRPMFWASREEARRWVHEALPTRQRRGRQPRRVGDGVGDREPPRRGLHAGSTGGRQAGARRACSRAAATSRSRCRRCRSTWSTASAPATRSAARCATGCSRAGTLERDDALLQRRGRARRVAAGVRRRDADRGRGRGDARRHA